MRKNLIIGIFLVVLILLTSAITYAVNNDIVPMGQHKTPSDYKIGIPYDQALKSDKPMLALFYVDWCGYCLRFMPKFKVISMLYKDKYNIVMLNAEDPQNEKLIKDVTLSGFPTLYVIDNKYENRFLLNNAIYMDLKKLRVELDRYLKVRERLELSDSCKK